MPERRSAAKPGRPVRGSSQGRPIMALLDLLGRRWTLRILWELREGPAAFNELQRRCDGMSPSVLAQRLNELREAKLIETAANGEHQTTRQANSLGDLLLPLDRWSKRWARTLK